jgi:hypothetical protein
VILRCARTRTDDYHYVGGVRFKDKARAALLYRPLAAEKIEKQLAGRRRLVDPLRNTMESRDVQIAREAARPGDTVLHGAGASRQAFDQF